MNISTPRPLGNDREKFLVYTLTNKLSMCTEDNLKYFGLVLLQN
jgi:hypothetical protein